MGMGCLVVLVDPYVATMIDGDARALSRQFGQMSEGRLMLMTALMIADRLSESESIAYQLEDQLAKVGRRTRPDDLFSTEREAELTERVNDLIGQVETLQKAIAC